MLRVIHSAATNKVEVVMKIQIGERVYDVGDSCPADAPTKRELFRHLRDHGLESLLTSTRLSQFAGCIEGIVEQEGVEVVREDSNEEHPRPPGDTGASGGE